MLMVCGCGRTKATQPFKSAAVKRMLCDQCKKTTRIVFVGSHRIVIHLKYKARVVKLVDTSDLKSDGS